MPDIKDYQRRTRMNVLFTICGRAGSKGFKNKNLKQLNGVPLVYYTLSAIRLYMDKHTEVNVTVALNTDSKELQELIATQHVVENVIFAKRKEELAGDLVAKVEVIRDTYFQCKNQKDFDVVVDLDITSPMRRLCDVESAIETLLADPNCDLVYSVVPARRSPYFNMVEKKSDYYRKICPSEYTARQQAPKSYELNASIYAYSPKFLSGTIDKTILDYNCGVVVMPDCLVLDIDSEEDFEMMEILFEYYAKRDSGLREIVTRATFSQMKNQNKV